MKKAEFYIELTLSVIVLLSCIFAVYYIGSDGGNELRWKFSGIHHYRYNLLVICFFCQAGNMGGPYPTIEVQDGKIIEMAYESGSAITPQNKVYEAYSQYGTVENLFSFIRSDYAQNADEVTVVYDPTYGFPSSIQLDSDTCCYDGVIGVYISEFEVLP